MIQFEPISCEGSFLQMCGKFSALNRKRKSISVDVRRKQADSVVPRSWYMAMKKILLRGYLTLWMAECKEGNCLVSEDISEPPY